MNKIAIDQSAIGPGNWPSDYLNFVFTTTKGWFVLISCARCKARFDDTSTSVLTPCRRSARSLLMTVLPVKRTLYAHRIQTQGRTCRQGPSGHVRTEDTNTRDAYAQKDLDGSAKLDCKDYLPGATAAVRL